jgi:hypothetical protein
MIAAAILIINKITNDSKLTINKMRSYVYTNDFDKNHLIIMRRKFDDKF